MNKVWYLEVQDFDAHGNLKPHVGGGKPVILMAQGNFCGYCQKAKPEFQKLANNINGVWENDNSQSLTEIYDISDSNDLNVTTGLPSSVLIILVIIGFFFAKKHQDIVKKHKDLAKRH